MGAGRRRGPARTGRLKRYLIIFALFIGALVAAALIIPSFLDWTKYRTEIESAAEAATGRDVQIDGDISFAVLPSPALTAEKITLANTSGGAARDMATVDALDVRVGLWPLLLGRVEVRSIVLVRPIIALEVLQDGRRNWDFSKQDASAPAQGGRDVQVDHFAVKDGTLTYEDLRNGSRQVLRQINIAVAAPSLKGPVAVSGDLAWRQTPLKLDARMGVADAAGAAPLAAELEVGGARIKFTGTAKLGDALAMDGQLGIRAANLTPFLAAVHAMTEGEGEPAALNLPLNVEADVKYGADKLDLGGLTVVVGESTATGTVTVGLGEVMDMRGKLALSLLDLDAIEAARPEQPKEDTGPKDILAALEALAITGALELSAKTVRYGGQNASNVSATIKADGARIDISGAEAALPGGGKLALSGRFVKTPSPNLTGRLDLQAASLRQVLEWLDAMPQDIAQNRFQAIALTTGLRLEGDAFAADDLKLKLDGMSAQGRLRYVDAASPLLDADLTIDRLDLTGYVSADVCAFGNDAKPAEKPAAAEETARLKLKARIGQLKCGKLKGQNLVLDIEKTGDALTLNQVQAAMLAGLAVDVRGVLKGAGDAAAYDLAGEISGRSLAELEQVAPGLVPLPPKALTASPVALTFAAKGDAARIAYDGQGTLGGTKLQGKGVVVPAAKGKTKDSPGFQSIDTTFSVAAGSLAALIEQWELGLTPPAAADDRPVSLAGSLKGPASSLVVDTRGSAAGAAVTLVGTVQRSGEATAFDLKTKIDGKDARAFVRGLGVEFGDGVEGLGPIILTTAIVGNDDSISLNAVSGQFGPVMLNGAATIKRGEPRPVILGEFRAGDIPADRFLRPPPPEAAKPKPAKGKKAAPVSAPPREWSKEPFDTAWLNKFDADVKLRADSMTLKGYRFEQPKFTLVVQNGQLRVDGLTGKLFDGDVTLDFAFGGAAQNPLVLKFDIRNASMAKALQTAADITAVTGAMNLSGTFNGGGSSPYDLVRSINGGADLSLSDGIVKGIDLPRLSQGLAALRDNGSLGSLLAGALAGGQTKHKGFAGKVTAQNGVLNLANMVVELDAAKGLLAAAVDLPKWSVASNGRLQLSEHPDTPAIGVGINGLLNGPNVVYDTKAFKKHMEAQIARAVLQSVTTGGGLNQLLGRPAPQAEPTEGQGAPTAPAETQPSQPQPTKPQDPGKVLLDQLLKSIDKKKQ